MTMTGTNFYTPIDANIKVALADEPGMAKLISCTVGNLPTGAGYAIGCMAAATDTGAFYTNTGTATVASFTLISASAVTLPTAQTDASTTTGASLSDTASAITTGKIIKAINGNTTNFTTGAACFYGDMGTAAAGNGLVVVGTGTYTGTGLVTLTSNALTTGSIMAMSATGQTSGSLVTLVGGGANITTGTLLSLSMGAATAGQALYIVTSGVYAGSNNLVNITANSATTTTGLVSISATGLTSGTALVITCTEATLTTGKYIQCYDGAANDFSVGKYGATIIAGNSSGTAALTVSAGDIVVTSGFVVLSANAKGISFTGTGANGGVLLNLKNAAATALSGTQKDIEISIGGVPYYFTVYPTKA